ncbi:hypothetical protein EDB85DRAFT_1936971 [Lactarius pseudohatsudake]|nr:hypothetical protein EDB85DRAFT_1936971 [Lactarius pseudohatsudake]
MFAPRPSLLHSSPLRPLSGPSSVRLIPTLSFVTIGTLVPTLFNASTTLLTHTRKFWSKYKDFGNIQNGIPESRNIPAQRLRLGQFTPRALRLFSTLEARLQVQVSNYSRHTKTFASASRRHTAISSPSPRQRLRRPRGNYDGQLRRGDGDGDGDGVTTRRPRRPW